VATFTAVDATGNVGTETVSFTTVAQNAVAVTAEGPAVQGGDFPLTVTSAAIDDVDLVTVTGDCVDDQPFAPGGGSTEDSLEFAVEVAPDAPVGACVLTVVTSFTDESGLQDETDTVTVTITADTTAPNIFSSVADVSAGTVTLTYTEPVVCDNSTAAAAAFTFSDSDDTAAVPTAIACAGGVVTLTFGAGVIESADTTPNINYTDEAAAVDVNDVTDGAGNQALGSDDSVPTVVA
jgi:hypothetical protein